MLDTLRNGSTNLVVKGILILIALSFVAWGIGDIFHGGKDSTVATIGSDDKISKTELDHAVRQEIAKLQQQFRSNFTEDQLKALNIDTMVLNQIINRKLMEKAINDLNLQVGDQAIISNISANPMFHNEHGQFDKHQYNALLRNNNMNEAAYIAILKNEIATNFLFGTLVTQQPVQDQLVSLIHNYKNEQRIVNILTISHNLAKDFPAPTEAEIASYYASHKAEYTAPEYRTISYFTLKNDDILKQVAVSESEMIAEFNANINDYQKPETRDVENLIFTDEQQAKTVWNELAKETKKSNRIKALADKGNKFNLLRAVTKADLPEEVRETVFSLEKGSVSEPVQSSFGWHILHVTAITPPVTAPFETHRSAVQKKLIQQKAESSLYATANKLEDDFAEGSTLEEVAAKYGLKTVKIDSVDAKGETIDGKKPELPHAENLLAVAFATDTGAISPLTLTPEKNGYFVVRVDKMITARPKTLEEVRPQVILVQTGLKQGEASKKRAEDIQQKLNSGATMAQIAQSYKLPLAEKQVVVRPSKVIYGREDTAYPHDLIEDLFSLKSGGISHVHQSKMGDYLIGKLETIKVADDNGKAEKDEIRRELSDRIASDLSDQYIAYLRKQYPVTITQPSRNVSE